MFVTNNDGITRIGVERGLCNTMSSGTGGKNGKKSCKASDKHSLQNFDKPFRQIRFKGHFRRFKRVCVKMDVGYRTVRDSLID